MPRLIAKKSIVFFIFIISFSFVHNSKILSQNIVNDITISGNYNASISNILSDIALQKNVKIYFNKEWFEHTNTSISFNNTNIYNAISQLLTNTDFQCIKIQSNYFTIFPAKDIRKILKLANANEIETSAYTLVGNVTDIGKFKKADIKGKVVDGKTGEPLIGATIAIKNSNFGCITDVHGSYFLSLSPGLYSLNISNIGYEDKSFDIKLVSTGDFNAELFERSIKLEEVIVSAQKADRNVKNNQMSILELDKKALKQIPPLFGEKDVVKSLTLLPGVKSVGEFGSGINVRGGSSDQNLFLVEGTPLFSSSHVFGLISVLNPDAVNNVTLYKGHIPPSFGERVSSVMDIQVKEGSYSYFHANGGVGLLNSRATVEMPIVKNKASISIGGRTSYSDWLLKQLPDLNLQNSSAKFYDVDAIASWIANEKNKFTLFAYHSNDNFKYASLENYSYQNNLGSLNWSHKYNSSLNSNVVFAYSQYVMQKDILDTETEKSRRTTEISYFSAKDVFTYQLSEKQTLEFGLQSILYKVNAGKQSPLNNASNYKEIKLDGEKGLESALYINHKYDLSESTSLQLGIRFSGYQFLGPFTISEYNNGVTKSKYTKIREKTFSNWDIIKQYYGLEPRLSFKYLLNENSSLKVSYNRNIQFLSLISYTSISTPDDIWKLSSPYILPAKCNQFALGYFKNFSNNEFETSAEVYYKKLTDLVDYKNGAQIPMNKNIETELLNTSGYNYGMELLLKKNGKILEGWISYTYSRSLRQTNNNIVQEQINSNNKYPSGFDKPHDFTIMSTYHKNKRLRATLAFNYATGRAVTLPESTTELAGTKVVIFSDRNAYRLPDYHRLDFSISFDESLKINKKWKGSWTLSVMNVYARKNAYTVIYKKKEAVKNSTTEEYSLYKLYIIGKPLPTLTYNFIF